MKTDTPARFEHSLKNAGFPFKEKPKLNSSLNFVEKNHPRKACLVLPHAFDPMNDVYKA